MSGQGFGMVYVLIAVASFAGGVLQGVTGFGAGLVLMMALPALYPVPTAAALSGVIFFALCASMVWRYRSHLRVREIIPPLVVYMVLSGSSAYFSSVAPDQELVKRAFGIFLIVLSAYYLLVADRADGHAMGPAAQWFCVAVSGLCDGLFGIGGPLLVVYFLDRFPRREERLGSLQLFFAINVVYTTVIRALAGAFPPDPLPILALGIAAISAGLALANVIARYIDDRQLRRLTYVLIGICGVMNVW